MERARRWLKQTAEEVCVVCIIKSICSCRCENFVTELKRKCKTITFKNGDYVIDPTFIDYNDGSGIHICGGTIYSSDGKVMGHVDPPGRKGSPGTVGKMDP
jgi:hypothetical protein